MVVKQQEILARQEQQSLEHMLLSSGARDACRPKCPAKGIATELRQTAKALSQAPSFLILIEHMYFEFVVDKVIDAACFLSDIFDDLRLAQRRRLVESQSLEDAEVCKTEVGMLHGD